MYFQSYSALSLIKVNSGWFHVGERGVFSSIFGSMIQMGRAGVYWLLPLPLIVALPWQWKFFIPAAAIGVMTIVTIFVVQDTPKDAGLPEFDTAGRDQRRHREGHVRLRRAQGVHQPDRAHDRGRRVLHRSDAQGLRGVVPALHAGGAAPQAREPDLPHGRVHHRARRASPARSSRACSRTRSSARAARRSRSSATRWSCGCLWIDLAPGVECRWSSPRSS